jgi:hypothetical protein
MGRQIKAPLGPCGDTRPALRQQNGALNGKFMGWIRGTFATNTRIRMREHCTEENVIVMDATRDVNMRGHSLYQNTIRSRFSFHRKHKNTYLVTFSGISRTGIRPQIPSSYPDD